MENSPDLTMKSLLIIIFFLICSTTFPSSRGEEDYEKFRECSQPYECGEIKNISYPFYGDNQPSYCGYRGFQVSCTRDNRSVIKPTDLEFQLLKFNINGANHTNTIRVRRLDMLEGPCSPSLQNKSTTLSFPYNLFLHYPQTFENLTLYYCDTPLLNEVSSPNNFTCPGDSKTVFYANDSSLESLRKNLSSATCNRIIQVPILKEALDESTSPGDKMKQVHDALIGGFEVVYPEITACTTCEDSGGQCANEEQDSVDSFRCFCTHGTQVAYCLPPPHQNGMLSFLNLYLKITFSVFSVECFVTFFFFLRTFFSLFAFSFLFFCVFDSSKEESA